MKQFNVIALLVFLGALVWILFLDPESSGGLRSKFLGWFSPVVRAAGAVQGEGEVDDVRTKGELLVALKQAEEEVFNLRFKQRDFDDLENENVQLREALDFKENKRYDLTIPAQVIKRNRTSWWATVTINRGRRHRVTADLPVISRDHAVIGKIIPNGLTEETAEVLLLTDEQCQVAARVGRSQTMQGIVQGYRGMGNLVPQVRLMYLDPEFMVPAGAMLYTDDGDGQVFPPGLLIGRVVEQLKGDLYDSAIVEPHVDFSKLNSLFVVRMAGEKEGSEEAGPVAERAVAP